jgi:hypothetical protein
MMNTAIRVIVASFLLCAQSTQAAILQKSDIEKLYILRKKLATAQIDVTQTMENAGALKNYVVFDCLSMIHNQVTSLGRTAAAVSILASLSVVMSDSGDEFQVLRALHTYLSVMSDELSHARQIINAWMTRCSSSATVNVKAQTILDLFAELEGPITSLSRSVMQVVPPKQ